MGHLEVDQIDKMLRANANKGYTSVVAFRPTGWAHTSGGARYKLTSNREGSVHIYSVSYSEHSSFAELREFVSFMKPQKVIPTVGGASQKQINMLTQRSITDLISKV